VAGPKYDISTLANLKHHVRTAFGDLDKWEELGIGQGNGAGPHIWVAESMPLFEVMRAEGLVAQLICALLKTQHGICGQHRSGGK